MQRNPMSVKTACFLQACSRSRGKKQRGKKKDLEELEKAPAVPRDAGRAELGFGGRGRAGAWPDHVQP